MLQIGSNNLWTTDSPEKIAAGTKKIVEAIQAKLPKANVLVLGILPAQKSSADGVREKIKAVNAMTSKLADGASVHYLDIGAKFVHEASRAQGGVGIVSR